MNISPSVSLPALALSLLMAAPVAAQQIEGTPGAPSATTTIDGKQIPAAATGVRRHDRA